MKKGLLLLLILFIIFPASSFAEPLGEIGFNTSAYMEEVEKLADKWEKDQEFFLNSAAYRLFISEGVLIHGMGNSPNFRFGKTLTYYNYSDPTIFFLPPEHKGGILSLFAFYHGDRKTDEVNITLGDKSYVLTPQRATDEYLFNAYLQKRPVWDPGIALSVYVPQGTRYVKLKADSVEVLFARVGFLELSRKTAVLPEMDREPTATVPLSVSNAPAASSTVPTETKDAVPTDLVTAPEQPGGLAVRDNWFRFTSNVEKFYLDYPQDWSIVTSQGQSILELTSPSGTQKVVVTKDALFSQTLKGFADQVANAIGMERINQISQEAQGRLRRTARVSLGDRAFYLDVLFVKQGDYVFTITAISPEENKDDYGKEVETILSSFTLL